MARGNTHDEHIKALFKLNNDQDILALQKAVYLTLDATERDKDKINFDLSFLINNYGLSASITYDSIKTPNTEHQWYTHLGWEYNYSKILPKGWFQKWSDDQQNIFTLRKNILINTINNIFPLLSEEKSNSLAALSYYTHIAGDLRYNDTPDNMIGIPELVDGLEKHLNILFGNKANNLINTIKTNLRNISFENDADPLDKTFTVLFETVPWLLSDLNNTWEIM